MNSSIARAIIRVSISGFLPAFIGRRTFWHKLYDQAAQVAIRGHFKCVTDLTYGPNQHENGWTA